MKEKKRILTVFGTRPEAIKMAPVVLALKASPHFDCRVAVTAQHRGMLDQVLDLFGIIPDHDLDIMRERQSLFDITTRALHGLERVMETEAPDMVLVHGDTTTTFCGALAAFYRQIPVGHVEAGLRTGDKFSPYPEEINRHLTGVLADLHFAPTPRARENLRREGVDPSAVLVTGNTVIDALLATAAGLEPEPPAAGGTPEDGRTLLVTTHRRENLGGPLRAVYRALAALIRRCPDVRIVFPVHKNPAVREAVDAELGGLPRVTLTEPLGYRDFVRELRRCHLVLTDSGGLQEEAPSLGKPVLVLRGTTERPEAVEAGTVRLVGTDEEAVFRAAVELLDDPAAYRRMAEAVNPYGDGRAAARIVAALAWRFGYGPPPLPFAENNASTV